MTDDHHQRLGILLQRFAANETTENETTEMLDLLKDGKIDREASTALLQILQETAPAQYDESQWEPMLEQILAKGRAAKIVPIANERNWRTIFRRSVAAAAILVAIAAGGNYFFNIKNNTATTASNTPTATDVPPGGNKAILTLANGTQIVLDSAGNGQLAQQSNATVIKLDSGMLAYKTGSTGSSEVQYNTLSTPRGGLYQVLLPDGTGVWLNAASSLRFPTAFTGHTRTVELTGEAYFEVAKNVAKPFFVQLKNGTQVQVLGTHFNVMAYDDEPAMKTSLLEGAVKLVNGPLQATLQPGQQASQKLGFGGSFKVADADVDAAISWKNGYFLFENADIETVMRQVSRWYDVDVVYEGKRNTSERFEGEISRSLSMMRVFKILEMSNIHIKLEGKKLTVLP